MVLSQSVFSFILSLFDGIGQVVIDVLLALMPVCALFILAQFFFLHYKKKTIRRIIKGILITVAGLVLFLQGVHNGYYPMARSMGLILGKVQYLWILVPIGFVLGLSVTLADPSIYVLVQETERVSGGAIRRRLMFITLCLGVGFAVIIAMVKLIFDISILWIIIPGYLCAVTMSYFVEPDFTALAFDSGSVVTGTMIASFILPLVTGIAEALGRDPLSDGFGIVGLVALTPILTMLLLGIVLRKHKKTK